MEGLDELFLQAGTLVCHSYFLHHLQSSDMFHGLNIESLLELTTCYGQCMSKVSICFAKTYYAYSES